MEDNIKSKYILMLVLNVSFLVTLYLGSNLLTNKQLTVEAAPAGFVKVGQKYAFDGVVCGEIVSLGANGWVRAKLNDGSFGWFNTDKWHWMKEGCPEFKINK